MEFKDIFSKNIMNKELHYITQQSTYTNNIHMNANDLKIMFSSYEYYKMSDIITIYNCLSDFSLKYFENKTISRDYEIIKKIVNFDRSSLFKIEEDYIKILRHYKYPSNNEISRIYPVCSYNDSSIVYLSRQIRYCLFKDFYIDIDLVNAHPTILYNFASENNIICPNLSLLVHNREEVFSNIMKTENKDKSSIKKKLLVILNLELLKNEKNSFYRELSNEIIEIRETIWKKYVLQETPMKDYLFNKLQFKNKSLNDQKKSAQTIYCFTKESELINILYNVLINYSKKFNTELSFIPFFDGAYARYKNKTAHSNINEYIDEVNKLIIPFKFVSKPIEPNWSYLNENILNNYKNIMQLSSTDLMSDKQLEILIDHFNIPNNNLCEKAYDIIKAEKKEEISKLNNKNFNEYLEMKTRMFARHLNKSLFPYSSDYKTLHDYIKNIINKNK